MTEILELSAAEAGSAPTSGPVPPVPPSELERHAPDLHFAAMAGAERLARCSCWWATSPPLEGETVGIVGHYAAVDADAGGRVLDAACDTLRSHGCTLAVGPMDGTTWRRYRFIVERGSEPTFFLEPDNPDEWPAQWTARGFVTLATYTSAVTEDLDQGDPRTEKALERLTAQGVAIRAFDPSRADEDLRRLYRLSLASFARNYLYAPIAEDEFLEQNRRLLPALVPELVLLAERGADLVGFLLAVPDLAEQRRTGRAATVIVKTVAVSPGSGHAGLGSVLVDLAQRAARARGFSRAIHALMHEDNVSINISRRYARTMRRYALFSRRL